MPSLIETDAFIRARGADAASFLHAQLTCRVDDLAPGPARLGAWCNAKGRVRAIFAVARLGDDIYLRLPASLVPLVLPRLKMFVLRSQLELAEIGSGLEEAEEFACALALFDDRDEHAEVLAGVPEIYPATYELFLPQMLNLDQLGAIDFKKGCYPGQEIVARTQHLGQIKRRMFLADSAGNPEPGTAVISATTDEKSGTVVRVAHEPGGRCQLLAVLPMDASLHGDLVLDIEDRPTLTIMNQ